MKCSFDPRPDLDLKHFARETSKCKDFHYNLNILEDIIKFPACCSNGGRKEELSKRNQASGGDLTYIDGARLRDFLHPKQNPLTYPILTIQT